jgi:lipopolysaccharide export system protein LptC
MALRLPRPGFRLWVLLILLALGGLLVWLDPGDRPGPGPVPRDAAGEPDYYLEGVRLTRFDAQGEPHQRLDTPRLVHTPQDDATRLTAPRAEILDDGSRTWLASGAVGHLGAGGNPLTLTGDARLQAPEENWHLETQILHYDADRGRAWSETPARLRSPPQEMHGDRFDAWLHDNRARLTDNVRGHHPPETRSARDEEPES